MQNLRGANLDYCWPMITVKPIPDHALLPDYTRVAAEVNYGWRRDKLWFDVPQTSAETINRAGDCWLMALLPLAFERGETLRIHAPVDSLLLANAEKIQRIWAEWHPPRKPIRVKTEALTERPAGGERIGLFFSGGVDSFFSMLHFDETAPAERKIDDLIFVWGFDIPLTNRAAFERTVKAHSEIAASLGKNAVLVATNLRETRLKKLDWASRLHGSAMGSIGLLLGKQSGRILLSSSLGRDDSTGWSLHGRTDPLMSNSQTRFIHYGPEFNRFDKTAFIAQSDVALRHLHVCWEDWSDKNCGRCTKCQFTLAALEILGVRDRALSFPPGSFSLESLRSIRLGTPFARQVIQELKKPAAERSRQDVVAAIDTCLATNSIPDKSPK